MLIPFCYVCEAQETVKLLPSRIGTNSDNSSYKFEYDSLNRITEITEFKLDTLFKTCTYTYLDNDSFVIDQEVSHPPKKNSKILRDMNYSSVYQHIEHNDSVFIYDITTTIDSLDNPISKYSKVILYMNSDNLIKEKRIEISDKHYKTTIIHYDDQQRINLISNTSVNNGIKTNYKIAYTYNTRNCKKSIFRDVNFNPILISTQILSDIFVFNILDQAPDKIINPPSESFLFEFKYIYNDLKYPKSIIMTDKDGETRTINIKYIKTNNQ